MWIILFYLKKVASSICVVMMVLRLNIIKLGKAKYILTPIHNPFLRYISGGCTHCNPVVAFGGGASVNPVLWVAVPRSLKVKMLISFKHQLSHVHKHHDDFSLTKLYMKNSLLLNH